MELPARARPLAATTLALGSPAGPRASSPLLSAIVFIPLRLSCLSSFLLCLPAIVFIPCPSVVCLHSSAVCHRLPPPLPSSANFVFQPSLIVCWLRLHPGRIVCQLRLHRSHGLHLAVVRRQRPPHGHLDHVHGPAQGLPRQPQCARSPACAGPCADPPPRQPSSSTAPAAAVPTPLPTSRRAPSPSAEASSTSSAGARATCSSSSRPTTSTRPSST